MLFSERERKRRGQTAQDRQHFPGILLHGQLRAGDRVPEHPVRILPHWYCRWSHYARGDFFYQLELRHLGGRSDGKSTGKKTLVLEWHLTYILYCLLHNTFILFSMGKLVTSSLHYVTAAVFLVISLLSTAKYS